MIRNFYSVGGEKTREEEIGEKRLDYFSYAQGEYLEGVELRQTTHECFEQFIRT